MSEYFSSESLLDLVTKIFVAHNTATATAETVAKALVQAQIDEQYGHGLSRVPSYAAQAKAGKIDGHAMAELKEVGLSAISINAKFGFAYPAMLLAKTALLEKAPTSGVAIASIYNSHHFGLAGYHAEQFANEGLMALIVSNSPKAIAPWGGSKGVFGTNPIAFAVPRKDKDPLVIDLSLSKIARGKVMVAAKEGREIPADWALDVDGNPTTDPNAAMAGTMLPMGDAKGAALVLMVEILAAALSGSQFGYEASSLFDAEGPPPALGHSIIAINPDALSNGMFQSRLEDLLGEILSQSDVRLPGERRLKARQRAAEQGIMVPEALMEEVVGLLG